jgi:RecA-family ATPase
MGELPEFSPIQAISASTWEGREIIPQQWLVEGMIPMLTTTCLSGDGGLGKSLLAMQLMTCCAAQKRFMNKDTKPALSVGLFCEDHENQLHERQQKINEHYQVEYKDLIDLNYLPRVGVDNALVSVQYERVLPTPFFLRFRELVLDMQAKLVVIDTAADTFMGNENIRTQVRAYIQLLNGLANDCQGAVVLLVHPSVAGLQSGTGTSGSTAWNNSVRSRWYLEKPASSGDEPENDNIRILSQKKSNYSALDKTGIELEWKEGVFQIKEGESSFLRKLELSNLSKECLDVIERGAEKMRFLSIYPNTQNYAPKILKEKMNGKHSYKDIKLVIEQMFDDGRLVNSERKYDGKTRLVLRAAENPPRTLEDTEI